MSDARTPGSIVVERPYQQVGPPSPGPAVRETAQGTWFLPVDSPGSLLRLPAGADAGAVRRLRRLGLPGLMPIATVLEDDGRVWVATPVPARPTVDDLLVSGRDLGHGPADSRCSDPGASTGRNQVPCAVSRTAGPGDGRPTGWYGRSTTVEPGVLASLTWVVLPHGPEAGPFRRRLAALATMLRGAADS